MSSTSYPPPPPASSPKSRTRRNGVDQTTSVTTTTTDLSNDNHNGHCPLDEPYGLSETVVLYENERLWLGRGFSKQGLYPGERGPYSTCDGTVSFATLSDANNSDLLGPGWKWKEGPLTTDGAETDDDPAATWTFVDDRDESTGSAGNDFDDSEVDTELDGNHTQDIKRKENGFVDPVGWRYSKDFSPQALARASPTRRALDFVRRRRLIRQKVYDPTTLFPINGDTPDTKANSDLSASQERSRMIERLLFRCDHCDSKAVQCLSDKLLEVLSIATLLQQTDATQILSQKVGIQCKAQLLTNTVLPFLYQRPLPAYLMRLDPSTRIHTLCLDILDKFPDHTARNLLSKSTYVNLFQRDSVLEKGLEDRMGEVNARFFGKEERDVLARVLIRHVDDPDFTLHCSKEHCGPDCEFAMTYCPNHGCDEVLSQKFMAHHEEHVCKYKLIDCPKECGELVPRYQMRRHLQQDCPLRDAACPFQFLGCSKVVLAKDAPQHLQEGAAHHLSYVASGMQELHAQLESMHARLEKAESQNQRLRKEMEIKDAATKREIESLTKELRKVHKEASGAHKETGRLSKNLKEMQNGRSHVK